MNFRPSQGCHNRMQDEDIVEICREAVFLERNRSTGLRLPNSPSRYFVNITCDRRQISQALTNILKTPLNQLNLD